MSRRELAKQSKASLVQLYKNHVIKGLSGSIVRTRIVLKNALCAMCVCAISWRCRVDVWYMYICLCVQVSNQRRTRRLLKR